jgi:eukaryotic-like serine/threonine-protein kinase
MDKRWKGELAALSQLDHPGIVRPRDAGISESSGLYIATDYVEGVTVRAVLNRGPMEAERVWNRAREVFDALEYAHQHGVLHCDLKPDNIMLCHVGRPDERAVVIDFGIAVLRETDRSVTATANIAGALDYMAPEQLGGRISAATDVYSLAATLFEMLTGNRWRHAESQARWTPSCSRWVLRLSAPLDWPPFSARP